MNAQRMAMLALAMGILCCGWAEAQDPIVAADAKLELLFDGGLVLTEGVAVAPDGMVYFSDITFSHVSKNDKGVIEAGYAWTHYWSGKHPAAGLFSNPMAGSGAGWR